MSNYLGDESRAILPDVMDQRRYVKNWNNSVSRDRGPRIRSLTLNNNCNSLLHAISFTRILWLRNLEDKIE